MNRISLVQILNHCCLWLNCNCITPSSFVSLLASCFICRESQNVVMLFCSFCCGNLHTYLKFPIPGMKLSCNISFHSSLWPLYWAAGVQLLVRTLADKDYFYWTLSIFWCKVCLYSAPVLGTNLVYYIFFLSNRKTWFCWTQYSVLYLYVCEL